MKSASVIRELTNHLLYRSIESSVIGGLSPQRSSPRSSTGLSATSPRSFLAPGFSLLSLADGASKLFLSIQKWCLGKFYFFLYKPQRGFLSVAPDFSLGVKRMEKKLRHALNYFNATILYGARMHALNQGILLRANNLLSPIEILRGTLILHKLFYPGLKPGATNRKPRWGFQSKGLSVLLPLILLFLFTNSFSQDFKKQFRKAKELFKDGDYSASMDAFSPLAVYDKNNPYTEYALFYNALSAQRLGFTTVAKSNFVQLKKLYPQWQQINEVNYWLTKLYFDQSEYFQALLVAKEIQDSSFRPSVDSLKRSYLSKIDDVETLKMVLEENPVETEAARALAKAIGKQGFTHPDLPLLDSILLKYNWPRDEFITAQANRSIFKDRYRIALLLPFRTSTLEPSPERKKNQLILDLYQGIKLAADSLNKVGIHLDLLVYDTDRSVETTKSILAQEELKTVDLIIGPFFADETKVVQEFSRANQINLIANPVSNNSDFLADNPYALLYQPTHETIGSKSAEMVAAKVRNKNCIVFFSDSPKDSVMAFNFIRRALELGVRVVYAEEVRKETSAGILETLAKPTEYDEWKNPLQFTLKKDSIGSIFVASDNPLIYTKVINSVETRGDSILVVGEETWLEDNSIDYAKFERTSVAFASPNFCPVDKASYLAFRKAYLKRHGVLPPENASKGYDLLMTLGKAISKYGVYFQDGLLVDGPLPGELTAGFWLQPARDNGFVPFVSFAGGELKEVR
ncbi:MAG: hypothetical protein ACKVOQ_04605 [Cyclobacteriaceae bacterium]